MKYLLDTHVLLWILTQNKKLSKKIKELYLDEKNQIYISLVSIWELAIKAGLQKIELGEPINDFIQNQILVNDIQILFIDLSHVVLVETLPSKHRDPFDRLIICQCIKEKMPVCSYDTAFDQYGINRIW